MLEKISLLFLFYLPLQVAISPTDAIDLASIRVFVLILFVFWLIRALFIKKLLIPFGLTPIFLYLFLFFCIFSLFLAQNSNWAMRKTAFIFSILPVYFIFYSLFKKRVFFERALRWITYGALIVAILGILQFFSQFIYGVDGLVSFWGKHVIEIFLGSSFSESVLENSSWLVNISGDTVFRAISVFPDPHMFSFYMGMTAPIALSIYLRYGKGQFLIFFLIILFADFLTFSRGGYFGLASALLAGFLFFSNNAPQDLRKSFRIVAYSIPALLILIMLTPFGERFAASFNMQDTSNSGRIAIWGKALDTTIENPFGVGIGNFPLEIKPTAGYREPLYAHNLFLDLSSEIGFFGMISFAFVLISSYLYLIKKSRKDILYFGPALSICVFSFHSLTETPLFSVHILTLLLIIISSSNEN